MIGKLPLNEKLLEKLKALTVSELRLYLYITSLKEPISYDAMKLSNIMVVKNKDKNFLVLDKLVKEDLVNSERGIYWPKYNYYESIPISLKGIKHLDKTAIFIYYYLFLQDEENKKIDSKDLIAKVRDFNKYISNADIRKSLISLEYNDYLVTYKLGLNTCYTILHSKDLPLYSF